MGIRNNPRFQQLCADVYDCWQTIGMDVEACAAGMGESVSNAEAVESCLDADRLRDYPGGETGNASADFVSEMAKAGRYAELERAVRKACSLA